MVDLGLTQKKSTITELSQYDRYKDLLRKSEFISSDMLDENMYVVSYHSYAESDLESWNAPSISAV